MTQRELTCITCPVGCHITVTLSGKEVVSVEGNTCPRGKEYAVNECTNPMRTVTSTVACKDGRVLAVKTDRVIPKERMMDCMKMIDSAVVKPPVKIGDVVLSDVFGSNIVATENLE